IARLSLIDIVEISTEAQLVKETCGPRTIGIPSAPDAFAVMLVPNDQALKSIIIEMKLAAVAQSLNGSDKHQIRRARTETRPRRDDEEFPRLKMCRRLQPNLCKMRNRITTALWHLFHLLKNKVVVVPGERKLRRKTDNHYHDPDACVFHLAIGNAKIQCGNAFLRFQAKSRRQYSPERFRAEGRLQLSWQDHP